MDYKDAKAVLEICEKMGFEDWQVRHGSCDCLWECGHKNNGPQCYKEIGECEHITQKEPADITGLFTIDCDEFMGLSNEMADYLAIAHKALPHWVQEAERLQKCYDVTNQSWQELRAENERLREENEKLKSLQPKLSPTQKFALELAEKHEGLKRYEKSIYWIGADVDPESAKTKQGLYAYGYPYGIDCVGTHSVNALFRAGKLIKEGKDLALLAGLEG